MMYVLIILLTLSVIGILFILWKCMTDLNKRITELEKTIYTLQYQIDDVLCDINIVNENMLNTYGSLSSMKDEMRTIKLNDYERKSKFGRNTKRLSPRH